MLLWTVSSPSQVFRPGWQGAEWGQGSVPGSQAGTKSSWHTAPGRCSVMLEVLCINDMLPGCGSSFAALGEGVFVLRSCALTQYCDICGLCSNNSANTHTRAT